MVKLFISGDVVNYENEDGLICAEELANFIKKADYSICNFEAPIQGYGKPTLKSGVHHSQRKSTIKGLKKQGFNLLCLANNHIMDYGREGLEATMNEIESLNIDKLGAGKNFKEAYMPLIKKFGDVTIGFVNAGEAQFGVLDYYQSLNTPGYAWINHNKIDEIILDLKEKCDRVVVLSHAGLENYSIPQKEWRYRYKHFCNLGADLVIGSHPHVPQGYEEYNDSLIFYSLGNFYFDSPNYRYKEDSSFSLSIEILKDNKILFEPIFHHKEKKTVVVSKQDEKVDILKLNSYLDDSYEEMQKAMSLDIYNGFIKKNLLYSLNPFIYDGNAFSSFKKIINIIIKRRKKEEKNILSLHLLRNEAYYYASKNALEILAEEEIGGVKDE